MRTIGLDARGSTCFIKTDSEKLCQLGFDALTFQKTKKFASNKSFNGFDFVLAGALSSHHSKRLALVLSCERRDW